ncbi:MAG: cytochrome b N-terminal domain-containing protein [Cyanobacteria bacterium]|nr:cytochrome b N-terminal domain-containing protein [Cyanobacteriota bacterium]MDW8202154.1 cytochrome b N-terminal domain-containing protein [Cyanobacteriota bacterium SKYGB_h_bin112]
MTLTQPTYILRRVATLLSIAILTLCLMAAITGTLLSFYYEPTATGAHASLEFITNDVHHGWLIRTVHNVAGNVVVVLGLIQLVVLFFSRCLQPAWVTAWVSGVTFTLSAIGLGWTAMILDWSQVGYWRLKVELGTIAAIPVIGSQIQTLLTGGGFGSMTIQRMYTLHSYVLAIVAVTLAAIHLISLLQQERRLNTPTADKIASQVS